MATQGMDNNANASSLPATDRLDLCSDATAEDDRNKGDDLPMTMTAATLDEEVADADVTRASSASSCQGMDNDTFPLLTTTKTDRRLDLDPDADRSNSNAPARRPRPPARFFLAFVAAAALSVVVVIIRLAAGAGSASVSARDDLLEKNGENDEEEGSLSFPGRATCPSLPDSGTFDQGIVATHETTPSAASAVNCLDPNGPEPYILVSLGRSGSRSTWNIISRLTGMHTQSEEYPGSNFAQAESLLKEKAGDGGEWALQKLCQKQRQYPNAGVVGFKIKPFAGLLGIASFREGLESIAESSVKVVRSRRNLLDVMLSIAKHDGPTKMKAHCYKGNKNCVRQHMKAGTGMELETHCLLEHLEYATSAEDALDDALLNVGIKHVSVTYEKLYKSDDAEEWSRIFRFLGVGPTEGLTRKQVDRAANSVATSHPHHNDTLANFEEVKNLLQGTKFENLLH